MLNTFIILFGLYLIGSAISAGIMKTYVPRGVGKKRQLVVMASLKSWFFVGRAFAGLLRAIEHLGPPFMKVENRIVKPN